MENILFIAYQFPPRGGPGVQRSLSFVKYLRENGYEPIVLTVNEKDIHDAGYLVSPGKHHPIYSTKERVLIMKSCRYVDEVITYSGEVELLEILKSKKNVVRFLGEDYRGKKITGEELNIPIYYIDRSHGYSTSTIRKKMD